MRRIDQNDYTTHLLKFGTLNVFGLKTRSHYPDFADYFSPYDFLCFVETKLDETDIISLPGFNFLSQPRKQTYIRKSGGICILVKENISKYIRHLETDSDYIMWISLDKKLTNTDEHIILGIIYVPPTQSKYFNDEEILNLEREITSMCSSNKFVIITGDVNARTARLNDYVQADNFLSDLFDDETLSFFDQTSVLYHYDAPVNRSTSDTKTNNNGHCFCFFLSEYILNIFLKICH